VSGRILPFLVGILVAGAASAQTPQPSGAPCGPVKIGGLTHYPGEIWRDDQGQVHVLPSCPLPPGAPPPAVTQPKPTTLRVPLQRRGGNFLVPVRVNNAMTLNFIVDSGASDVTIPADVVATLMRAGTLSDRDFMGRKTYVIADGSKLPSDTFRIHSLTVGDWLVQDVTAGVTPAGSAPLLGQSFFSRLRSWSIDNLNQTLVLVISSGDGTPATPPSNALTENTPAAALKPNALP
jgi:clan AA aspartic protease (TIGR02281 family)